MSAYHVHEVSGTVSERQFAKALESALNKINDSPEAKARWERTFAERGL